MRTPNFCNFVSLDIWRALCEVENCNEAKKKPQMTLDKIRKDFKDIRGHLSPDNDILKGVDLNKLYAFIKAHEEIHTQSMYSIVDLYRQESGV